MFSSIYYLYCSFIMAYSPSGCRFYVVVWFVLVLSCRICELHTHQYFYYDTNEVPNG